MPSLPFGGSRREQGRAEPARHHRPCLRRGSGLQLLGRHEGRERALDAGGPRPVPHQSEEDGARHQDGVPRPAQGEGSRRCHLLPGAGRRKLSVNRGATDRGIARRFSLRVLIAGIAMLILAPDGREVVAAEGDPLHVPIVYLSESIEEPLPLSLVEPVAPDKGLAGAKLAIGDNNTTGQFLKQNYELVEKAIPAGGDLKAAARELAGAGQKLIVSDLTAPRLAELADLPEMKDAIILNIRAEDDGLRASDCRANVFHVIPSRAMKADALGQFLVSKRWLRWVLVYGVNAPD